MGLLPTKGLTLPLISYGRSSMIVALVSIGILMRIHHELQTDDRHLNSRKSKSRAKR
jgi:cell division protein FtsW